MAKHCFSRTSKTNIARALLGATVIASALGGQAAVASADTAQRPAAVADHDIKSGQAKVNVTAAQVLAVAKSQVGTSENAAGGGTKYQDWYAASPRAAETVARDGGTRTDYLNGAWCAMFVSWVGNQSGAHSQIGADAYTVAYAKWFEGTHRFGTVAKPGAVVFFAWNGGKDLTDIRHVGFVVKDNQNGTISTIEGNTGNGKVEERVRPKSDVVGYGYPEYAA
ncbi:CHAP domain-containing protein [Nonomuraea sp. M3C6]|uniref:CHAP domain-containing protein n=1 Tax=Nonomuraea marmarensis TaxID=3351344 RepID=A0ABW7AFP4_9ACTN